jgi:Flp pilus assembly protein TadB
LAQHTQQLVEDLKTWVDLRIKLVRVDLEEQIQSKANEVALAVTLAVVAFLAVVFGLTTAALGLGAWLGHPAWGFLIVTVLLVLLAVVLRAARPEFIDVSRRGAADRSEDATSAGSPR